MDHFLQEEKRKAEEQAKKEAEEARLQEEVLCSCRCEFCSLTTGAQKKNFKNQKKKAAKRRKEARRALRRLGTAVGADGEQIETLCSSCEADALEELGNFISQGFPLTLKRLHSCSLRRKE